METDDIATLEQENRQLRARNERLEKELAAVARQRDELAKALRDYGGHKNYCDYARKYTGEIFGTSTGTCDCGFLESFEKTKGGA
jgi:hypothetical protein